MINVFLVTGSFRHPSVEEFVFLISTLFRDMMVSHGFRSAYFSICPQTLTLSVLCDAYIVFMLSTHIS